MSTLARLRGGDVLAIWELAGRQQTERCFYYTVECEGFFNSLPREMSRAVSQRRRLPMQAQIRALVNSFVRGTPPASLDGMEPPFKPMQPRRHRVWAMRTSDTRSFGWFVQPNIFIAVCGDRTSDLKADPALYEQGVEAVTNWRVNHRIAREEIASATEWRSLVT